VAEAEHRRALAIGERQFARAFGLKTAVSLGRFLADTRRGAEAHALLEPTYAWFAEGFGTTDLVTARAFLDLLRATRA
jgi:predicted ATPase